MNFEFKGDIFEWRGPAPFYFVRVPEEIGREIKASAAMLTYGWGVIPARITIGKTEYTTSLFPKDGSYLVPIKNAVRLPEKLELGQTVEISMSLG